MTPPDRLCALKVRIPRHQQFNLHFRPTRHHLQQINQVPINHPQFIPKPQPHIRRNLLVPTPPRMQLPSDLAPNNLTQPPLIRSMDILIRLLGLKRTIFPLLPHLLEPFFNPLKLSTRQDPSVLIRARKGDGAGYVLGVEDAVVG